MQFLRQVKKFQKLLDDLKFVDIQTADEMIEWESVAEVKL